MQLQTRIEFDSAHRLLNYKGKCGFMHGHRWVLDIFIEGPVNPHSGFIIDFGVIKKDLKENLDFLDHSAILSSKDPLLLSLFNGYMNDENAAGIPCSELSTSFSYVDDCRIVIVDDVTSCENLIVWLWNHITDFIKNKYTEKNLKLSKLILAETPNNACTYEGNML